MFEIYLDSNVYLSVARRETVYEYTLARINNLYKKGVLFPHSPAHAEEVASRFLDGREFYITKKFKNLISRFNGGKGYIPGQPNIPETKEIIFELECNVANNPDLQDAINIYKKKLWEMQTLGFDKSQLMARMIDDDFENCIHRVQKYLNLTDVALKNDKFHLGRRTEKALRENFSELSISSENVETFDDLRKRYKLEPRRLANITADEIFNNPDFINFAKHGFEKNGVNFTDVPKGEALFESFHKKEGVITLVLNCLERAGYFQEDKNRSATLSGRMFDVTHVIYASDAKYFVTGDIRLAKKATATYRFLKIPTKVIAIDEFVGGNLMRDIFENKNDTSK